jgi:cytochrome c oxidase subunit 1
VFGLYAGFYHWFPKMTGRMMSEAWGQVHFWMSYIGFNLAFLPMHKLGLMGMNRRIAEYDPKFATLNLICTIGTYILALSTIPFIVNAAWSWLKGKPAGDNPWRALTLEWMTTSPPPVENFDEDPILATGPYDYGMGDRDTEVDVPLDNPDAPSLAAGPSSTLRAKPDPAVAVSPSDRSGESRNRD